MEDDDEFGDLYTDVLRPLTTSFQSHPSGTDASKPSPSRPIDRDVNSDDEEILYGASDLKNSFSNSNQAPGLKLKASIHEKTLTEMGPRPERGGLDLNSGPNMVAPRIVGGDVLELEAGGLEKGGGVRLPEKGAGGLNFMEEDDLNIVVEEGDSKDDDLVVKDVKFTDKQENVYGAGGAENENMVDIMGADAVGEMDPGQMIPGLSGKLDNQGGPNFEDDWDSDESEDDLRIVLNDNHPQMGMERMAAVDDEDDEEGEPLVIVADNGDMSHRHQHPMMMDDQEWGGEEGGAGADGERKELADAAKASGGGGTAASTAVQPKIGYSNHMFHHPFHSQFKYVRPGAAPMPGPAPVIPGGSQGQARPSITMSVVGRGRGDWRPPGVKGTVPMQKGLHPGFGVPAWGANSAGRGYGSGLDFTLPSHKTIFEVDIDGFEEKPWRLPGVDVSDFFNFGLNEESWKEYCKQLEQLRLETTMQSKIRVYESGRAEQDYDPDLPPELAAAVGMQDIPSENANAGKADAGATDLARGNARGRPPIQPMGRPIPVETGSGDRAPSIDTRRPRMQDSDAVIVIVCQGSADDDDMAEQQDNDQAEDEVTDDLQQDDANRNHHFSDAYNGQKRELVARRELPKNIVNRDNIGREDDLCAVSEAPMKYHPDREIGVPHEERSARGRGNAKFPKMTASGNSGDKDDQSFDSEHGKRNPRLSSSCAIGSDGEHAVAVVDDVNDISVMDDKSSDMEREDVAPDATNSDALEDGKLMHSTTRQKRISQHSQENDDGDDSKAARSSENSKARSGSSKDHRKSHDTIEDEVLQNRHHHRAGSYKRPVGDENNSYRRSRHGRDEIRKHVVVKEREDSHPCRGGDPNSSLHRHMKSESTEWRKESDMAEGSWRRRDEDLHGRRIRVEDTRKREHTGEISSRNRGKARESERGERDEYYQSRNLVDSGSLRGSSHDQGTGSRQRDRGDLKNRSEKVDDLHNKRRREGAHINREFAEKDDVTYNHREGSSRRKRERDDSSDQRKADEYAKLKDDDMRYVRQKEEGSLQKERGERQRDRDDWQKHKQVHEEIIARREREEARPVMRSGRPVEDKTWTSHSRGKDDYKGSGREYQPKDFGRHSDQLKRRDRIENESFSQHRGHEDVYERGNDEKRARYEKLGTSNERNLYASDTSRLHERRPKEVSRQNRESENQDPSSLISSKRNQDEYSGQISETVNSRGRTERGSGENDIHANRHSSRKHGDEVASSDDEQTESKRGRSKLERWTSHKEMDFGVPPISSSSLKKIKDIDTHNNSGVPSVTRNPDEPSKTVEGNVPPPVDNKDTVGETENANAKAVEDKHLDTVEKLKKRSERFKLPMPSEKEAVAIKKIESEPLPSTQTENRPDSVIKSERPPRKRRWTGN